jgi:transcriptional regulator with XRE-family HTH domain
MKVLNMNNSLEWIFRKAKQEAESNISVGGFFTEFPQGRQTSPSTRLAFGRLVSFRRRDLGLTLEELAKKIKANLDELVRIEKDEAFVPEPRLIYDLAQALRLPGGRLMQLAGLAEARDIGVREAAVRFAARSESVNKLSKAEHEALEEFVKFLADK